MGATRRSAQGGCEGFGQACSGGNAEAWLQDLCQRDRASNDHMARPLLPLRHCGQDGPRLREEDTPLHAVNTGKVLLVLTPREVFLFEHCALPSCDGFASEGWGGAVSLGCGVIFRESMWFTNHETRCNTHRIRFGVV